MQTTLPSRDLLLIGAGHTNMHVARMWRMEPIPDAQLTLVSPFSRATYSGMLPGTLAGLYTPDDMEIDLRRFCSAGNIRLIVDDAIGLEPEMRRLHCRNRPPVRYDVASIGIGSVPDMSGVARDNPRVLGIKPMATFLYRLEAQIGNLLADAPDHERTTRVAVIGGGAAGVELTLCLDSLLRRRSIAASLALIDSGPRILPGYQEKTADLARREFERRGVEIRINSRFREFTDGRLAFVDGRTLEADIVITATSATPPPVLDGFALPKAGDGFLAVRPTLQTTADLPIFVVGDTGTIVDNPVAKAGVYAVREGPVLWENIRRILQGDLLTSYEPQRGFLSLLSSGDGRAIGEYAGFSAHGQWLWRWKDYIDRRFMRMYQDYRPMETRASSNRAADKHAAPEMKCRGCGGKVGARVLSAALDRLGVQDGDTTLVGLTRPDDAAVIDPHSHPVEVLSVDFFKSFLDDPYLVGRIAALNSLSDLWAMGADPTGAMAMVAVPDGPPRQQTELLYQLLAGGRHEFDAAGTTLLGGHTIGDSELTIGYTVIGNLSGEAPFTKAGLCPGDDLILTKPLGTGLLLAAHAECACRATWIDGAIECMLAANENAARIARDAGIAAATDITGFGLAGHVFEMLDASALNAELSLNAIPVLNGFVELADQGYRSSLDPANRELAVRIQPRQPELLSSLKANALFDPQTSGGLLLAISPERSVDLLSRLRESGCLHAAVIGRVVEAANELPVLRVVE